MCHAFHGWPMMKYKVEKPSENWTKFPNNLLDNIDKFTLPEWKIISIMVRKTLGFTNPNHEFSLSYLMVKLDLSKGAVNQALKTLR